MKGNKGEWSEIYTFLRLLGDGVIYGGDENLQKINSIYYPLISIIREENQHSYSYYRNSNVKVVDSSGATLLEINSNDCLNKAFELLEIIKSSEGNTFEIPAIEEFLRQIHVRKLKSDSRNKRDITVVVHDLTTNTTPTLGFSIKSRLGSPSTLLNPGKTTNFIYEINYEKLGVSKNELISQINQIDTRSKIKDRVKYLIRHGDILKFRKIESINFYLNLQLIDSNLPEILARSLLNYYGGFSFRMRDLVNILEENNPLQFNQEFNHKFYEYKIKNFLTDIALGMTPQKKWTGNYDATGGYIIVKEDGDIVCYHIYNRTEFQEYLLSNTYFDTPPSRRYDFGKAYENNGKVYIKLNMQIRFS